MHNHTIYTYAQLVKMNTGRLIATYNRIFNTNAWDVFFNPFDSRTEMLVELMDEMRVMKANELLGEFVKPSEPYKAVKIVVSQDGFAVLWNQGVKTTGGRKVTDDQIALIHELRADGETYKWIAQAVGVPQITVFRVLKGEYALEANRWNTKVNAPEQMKKRPVAKASFKAASRKVNYETLAEAVRPMNSYWQGLGL